MPYGPGGGGSVEAGSFAATFTLTDGVLTDTQVETVYYQIVGNLVTLYITGSVNLDLLGGDTFFVPAGDLPAAVMPATARRTVPCSVGGDPFLSGRNEMPGAVDVDADGRLGFYHASTNSISDNGTPYSPTFTQYAELFPGWSITYPLSDAP